jgi:Ca2+-binding RTX toxin-like protein
MSKTKLNGTLLLMSSLVLLAVGHVPTAEGSFSRDEEVDMFPEFFNGQIEYIGDEIEGDQYKVYCLGHNDSTDPDYLYLGRVYIDFGWGYFATDHLGCCINYEGNDTFYHYDKDDILYWDVRGYDGDDEVYTFMPSPYYKQCGDGIRIYDWPSSFGNAYIAGDGGDDEDYIEGSPNGDSLSGGADDDEIWGNGGDDYIYGYGGADYLVGGYGVDRIYGGEGSDTIFGTMGEDWLYGQGGTCDYLNGDGGSLDWCECGDDWGDYSEDCERPEFSGCDNPQASCSNYVYP